VLESRISYFIFLVNCVILNLQGERVSFEFQNKGFYDCEQTFFGIIKIIKKLILNGLVCLVTLVAGNFCVFFIISDL
jgi:hypothetical protein